jgi:hypothetical protein
MEMPDTTLSATIAEPEVTLKVADGFLVRLAKRRALRGGWVYDLRYFDDWYEAQACYEVPPGEWQALDIYACFEGKPASQPLSAYKITQLRMEG